MMFTCLGAPHIWSPTHHGIVKIFRTSIQVSLFLESKDAAEKPQRALFQLLCVLTEADERLEIGHHDLDFLAKLTL